MLAGICATVMLIGSLVGCSSRQTAADGDQINLRFSFWEPSTGKETETTLQHHRELLAQRHQQPPEISGCA